MDQMHYHGTDVWSGLSAISRREITLERAPLKVSPIQVDFYRALPSSFRDLSALLEQEREFPNGGLVFEFSLMPEDRNRICPSDAGEISVPEKVSLRQLKVVHFTPRAGYESTARMIWRELKRREYTVALHFMSNYKGPNLDKAGIRMNS